MKRQISEADAKSRLAALCAKSEHCCGEMLDKMRQWEVAEDAQARIMQYLIEHKFVDDERYTRAMAIDKVRYNKWGRKKIEQALWMKHVDTDIIKTVLDDIPDKEYLDVLRPLLKAKRKSVRGNSGYEITQKLVRFAMSRGFDYRLIKECLGDVDEDFCD
ncbi:MAG: RecX family transcriptional regulator [Prevotella sp.]|nr:RecX family transcriptional regulator [Prevotella sp.]